VPITGIDFMPLSNYSSLKITVSATEKPKKSFNGEVYQYIEVEYDPTEVNASRVIINFRISSSWFEKYNYSKKLVKLNRYNNNGWSELATTTKQSTKDYVYYSSNSPGLSLFAITSEKIQKEISQEPEENLNKKGTGTINSTLPALKDVVQEEVRHISFDDLRIEIIIAAFLITVFVVFARQKVKSKDYTVFTGLDIGAKKSKMHPKILQELENYIEHHLNLGYKEEEIHGTLRSTGWKDEELQKHTQRVKEKLGGTEKIDKELEEYLKYNIKDGKTDKEILKDLAEVGWENEKIAYHLEKVKNNLGKVEKELKGINKSLK